MRALAAARRKAAAYLRTSHNSSGGDQERGWGGWGGGAFSARLQRNFCIARVNLVRAGLPAQMHPTAVEERRGPAVWRAPGDRGGGQQALTCLGE